jgi:hypothetical protein
MVFLINDMAQASVMNNLVNYKTNFISKYGSTTNNYDELDQLGQMNNAGIFILIFIFAVVLCILSFVFSSKYDRLSKYLYYFGWFFLIVIIVTLGYGSYIYFFLYLPQWNEWYKTLPSQAKQDLMSIKTLNAVKSELPNNMNRSVGFSFEKK